MHRFELCTTPTWSCGERMLHGSLNVIHGCPVSKSIVSILRHSAVAWTVLCRRISPRAAARFVLRVALLEGAAVEARADRAPRRARTASTARRLDHALHEQVGNPVRRVHVVRAAALVAGVAAQIEEVLDVVVPGLEIGAGRAAPLAAAVDRHGDVVGDLQERHDALALDLGALDARAGAADVRPVVAEPARPLRELRVVAERLEDVREVVLDRRQVARRELRVRRAGVEQRRRRRHVEQRRHQVVEVDRARACGSSSSMARPIATRIQNACGISTRAAVVARQVAIGERLDAEVLEQASRARAGAPRPARRDRSAARRASKRPLSTPCRMRGDERIAVGARRARPSAGRRAAVTSGTALRAAAARRAKL